jgi:hypothetical protein
MLLSGGQIDEACLPVLLVYNWSVSNSRYSRVPIEFESVSLLARSINGEARFRGNGNCASRHSSNHLVDQEQIQILPQRPSNAPWVFTGTPPQPAEHPKAPSGGSFAQATLSIPKGIHPYLACGQDILYPQEIPVNELIEGTRKSGQQFSRYVLSIKHNLLFLIVTTNLCSLQLASTQFLPGSAKHQVGLPRIAHMVLCSSLQYL